MSFMPVKSLICYMAGTSISRKIRSSCARWSDDIALGFFSLATPAPTIICSLPELYARCELDRPRPPDRVPLHHRESSALQTSGTNSSRWSTYPAPPWVMRTSALMVDGQPVIKPVGLITNMPGLAEGIPLKLSAADTQYCAVIQGSETASPRSIPTRSCARSSRACATTLSPRRSPCPLAI